MPARYMKMELFNQFKEEYMKRIIFGVIAGLFICGNVSAQCDSTDLKGVWFLYASGYHTGYPRSAYTYCRIKVNSDGTFDTTPFRSWCTVQGDGGKIVITSGSIGITRGCFLKGQFNIGNYLIKLDHGMISQGKYFATGVGYFDSDNDGEGTGFVFTARKK